MKTANPPSFLPFFVCTKLLKYMGKGHTFTEFQVFDPTLRQSLFHLRNELSPADISQIGDANLNLLRVI